MIVCNAGLSAKLVVRRLIGSTFMIDVPSEKEKIIVLVHFSPRDVYQHLPDLQRPREFIQCVQCASPIKGRQNEKHASGQYKPVTIATSVAVS
jgi:hypothetical protein